MRLGTQMERARKNLAPCRLPTIPIITNWSSPRVGLYFPAIIYGAIDMDESILDDEEEWEEADATQEDPLVDDEEEDSEGAEMVIECPFEEPSAAMLDLDNPEALLENPRKRVILLGFI